MKRITEIEELRGLITATIDAYNVNGDDCYVIVTKDSYIVISSRSDAYSNFFSTSIDISDDTKRELNII